MDSWRVAVLGDGGVGKTALAVQFTLNCFIESYDPTIEDAYRKQLLVDERMCFVEVIDTAGQDEYATLRDQWVREGQGFILVYSIASRSTFDRLEIFRQSMMRVKRSRPIFMLVGNKSDKFTEREVSKEEGFQMAQSYGCEFMETSAKTSQNVENLFTHLIRSLRTTLPDPISPRSLATRDSHQGRGEKKEKEGNIMYYCVRQSDGRCLFTLFQIVDFSLVSHSNHQMQPSLTCRVALMILNFFKTRIQF